MTRPAPAPPPGSEAAMRAGCKCVFYDPEWLAIAREIMYSVDVRGCPLHDPDFLTTMRPLRANPIDNLTMRPRTDAETGGEG